MSSRKHTIRKIKHISFLARGLQSMKNKTLLKLYYVFCLDDNKKYGFLAENVYDAMQKLIIDTLIS